MTIPVVITQQFYDYFGSYSQYPNIISLHLPTLAIFMVFISTASWLKKEQQFYDNNLKQITHHLFAKDIPWSRLILEKRHC